MVQEIAVNGDASWSASSLQDVFTPFPPAFTRSHNHVLPIYFSFTLGEQVIRNNLILEKVCRVNLNLPESVCDDIQGHDDKQVNPSCCCFEQRLECFNQVLIQQKATMLNLYITAIVTLPTVIAPLILGPWLANFLKVLENNKSEKGKSC